MIKTKYAVAFAAVSVFSASVADASEASATYKWKMATPWSGGPLFERDAKGFANRVAELSEGRIKIDVFPGDRRSRLISSMTSVAPA